MSGRISAQIKQTKPLPSLETEAIINLLRTSSIVEQVCGEPLKAHDLTNSQYNVLRILRGAGESGHACQELAARMIRRDPDVTRLLDRLEARGLVSRTRSTDDRRVIVARITPAGLKLLTVVDPIRKECTCTAIAHLGEKRLRQLIDLLEEVREPHEEQA